MQIRYFYFWICSGWGWESNGPKSFSFGSKVFPSSKFQELVLVLKFVFGFGNGPPPFPEFQNCRNYCKNLQQNYLDQKWPPPLPPSPSFGSFPNLRTVASLTYAIRKIAGFFPNALSEHFRVWESLEWSPIPVALKFPKNIVKTKI